MKWILEEKSLRNALEMARKYPEIEITDLIETIGTPKPFITTTEIPIIKSEKETTPIRNKKHWTDREDEYLIILQREGVSLEKMVKLTKRSLSAIYQRLAYLNKQKER